LQREVPDPHRPAAPAAPPRGWKPGFGNIWCGESRLGAAGAAPPPPRLPTDRQQAGCGGAGMRVFRDAGMQGFGDEGMRGCEDAGCVDSGMQGHRDTGMRGC